MSLRTWIVSVSLAVLCAGAGVAVFQTRGAQALPSPAASDVTAPTESAAPDTEKAPYVLEEHALGSPTAPVTMIEYSSLTCGHCAAFHTTKLEQLKADYIDTGKVRFIFRDFPLDGVALKIAALAHCMPKESYFAIMGIFFQNQRNWITADDPVKSAAQYARLGGMTDEKAAACTSDTALLDAISAVRIDGERRYEIASTPIFILNDGAAKIMGNAPYEEFKSAIDGLLNK